MMKQGLGIGIVLAALAGAQTGDLKAVGGVFDQPGYPRLKVLGVCDLLGTEAACWGLDGKPVPEVTTRVQGALDRNSSSMGLYVRPGRKNRWVVVERTREDGTRSFSGWESDDGGGSTTLSTSSGESLELARLTTSASGRSASLRARIGITESAGSFAPSTTKPFEVLGRRAEIVKVVSSTSDKVPNLNWGYRSFPAQTRPIPIWTYTIALSDGLGRQASMFLPLDAKDQTIRFVDLKGVPVAEHKALEASGNMRQMGFPSPDPSRFPQAFLQVSYAGSNTMQIVTNIRPGAVAKVAMQSYSQQVVDFGMIPMDPSP